MFGFRVIKTIFVFNKKVHTKQIIKPHEFDDYDEYVNLDNFSDYALDKVVEALNDLGYSIPKMNNCQIMWVESIRGYEKMCVFGTKGKVLSTIFTLYCYEK